MRGFTFLELDEVLQIHADQVARYGGSVNVLDLGKIESAIAQPGMTFGGEFLHPDIAAMSAAYLYHLVMAHGFEDGNKRTGAAAAIVFLGMNDVDETFTNEELETVTVRVAAGEMSKEDLTTFFRSRVVDDQDLSLG